MRELSPEQQATTESPGTEPRYLVFVQLDEEYRLSTRETVMLNDEIYQHGDINIDRVSSDTCQFQVRNTDYRHTRNAMKGAYLRNRVMVYWAYGAAPGAHYVTPGYWEEGYTEAPSEDMPEAFLMFDGIIEGTPSVDAWLTINAQKEAPRRWPAVRIKPPFANHAPSAGYVIQFDGQALRIEGRQK